MIEEQRLYHALRQIDEIVVAMNVRQLVREDRLEMCGAQAGERCSRHDDNRFDVAEHHRHRHPHRGDERHRASNPQPRAQDRKCLLRPPGSCGDAVDTKGARPPPASGQADRHHRHTDDPGQHQPRYRAFHNWTDPPGQPVAPVRRYVRSCAGSPRCRHASGCRHPIR
jgi:hypothetical protein